MIEPLMLHVEAFWRSPWDFSAHVALREKGVDFHTSIAMTRPGVGLVDTMRERSLTGTAPVLQHGTLWLAESLAIIEYLEETFAAPEYPRILPAERIDRARARQLLLWLRIATDALRRERPIEHVLYGRGATAAAPPMSPAAQRQADDLVRVAERLGANGVSAGILGSFCMLDADLAFALMRLVGGGAELPAAVEAYARAIWARPSVREFIEHPRPPNAPPL
jgi:glutathione S-transferase